ncbi:MAG: NAD-dependent succinate-semialdehyde dehydrogenase [Marinilabiliaceae bacterium]|jgi:succinate-semialdehyde dehydrogenase/glutarate-semialdehyde dehydrogenase|nr:NAD-dependent succinate-semialdehyde dehydrogenase [Marinilabiliaceae bacterium]
MAYRSINPYSGEQLAEYPYITDNECIEAIDRSAAAFNKWRKTELKVRSELLHSYSAELLDKKERCASLMTLEMGKPFKQALAEVEKSARACTYYADNAAEFLEPVLVETPSSKSRILYEPQGTVFAIMPWNFPFWQVIRCLAPAVMSGNCVILKHASNVPLCALILEELFRVAGAPGGLFQNLFITHSQAADLIGSARVRSVSLTGSNIAGEIIAARAGSSVKKCVLELGGSDPFVVFADADLERAADGAVTGRFQNNGQSCIASKRLFVEDAVYDRFMDLFIPKVRALRTGDPMDPATDIGPLVNRDAVAELRKQVSASLDMGARVICGELHSKSGDNFFDPMVLEDVPANSPLACEETFGPVLPVFRFNKYEELILQLNSTVYGLGSSVWTSDSQLMQRIVSDIDAGTVSINGFTRSDPMLPFGGVKESGYGRELSHYGIMEFVNIKTVSVFE